MTHTQLNIVGSAGNGMNLFFLFLSLYLLSYSKNFIPAGVYSSGLLWGRIVDYHGPPILLSCGFIFLLGGYSGIRYFYESGLPSSSSPLPPQAQTIPNLRFILLVLCSFLTGCGGGAGLASTVNSTAKSFPDRAVRYALLYIYI